MGGALFGPQKIHPHLAFTSTNSDASTITTIPAFRRFLSHSPPSLHSCRVCGAHLFPSQFHPPLFTWLSRIILHDFSIPSQQTDGQSYAHVQHRGSCVGGVRHCQWIQLSNNGGYPISNKLLSVLYSHWRRRQCYSHRLWGSVIHQLHRQQRESRL